MKEIHHLTLQDRQAIQSAIEEGKTKAEIGHLLGKDPCGISREVFRHREFKERNVYNRKVLCAKRKNCEIRRCTTTCKEYVEPTCVRRDRLPGVCNGCEKRAKCPLDRGSEFEKVSLFEQGIDGKQRLNIFYCDAMQSAQKPHVENNHNYVRDIIPNGKPLDRLTQDDINIMFSHINSTPRKVLHGKTPYELFVFYFGQFAADALGIIEIPKDDVVLHPSLIFGR